MIEPVLKYDNGIPYLMFDYNGMKMVISFAKEESDTDIKNAGLGIITEQYNKRAF